LAVVAVVVVAGLLNLGGIIDKVQGKLEAWKYQRLVSKMQAPYKNDKYGGKTPEETFDLFLDALRREDVELASRYFVIPKQEGWNKTLQEYKKNRLLANFSAELNAYKNSWDKSPQTSSDVQEFTYLTKLDKDSVVEFNGEKIPFKAGQYRNSVVFEKYPSLNWKISEL